MAKKKKKGQIVREEILEAGLKIWRYNPSMVTTRNIAEMIGKSHVTVHYHFPQNGLRKAVARHGVMKGDSVVIVSLLLIGDNLVKDLTEEERDFHFSAVKELNKQ